MMQPAGGGQETTLIWSGQPRLLTTVAVITVIIMSNNEYPFSWLIYVIKIGYTQSSYIYRCIYNLCYNANSYSYII